MASEPPTPSTGFAESDAAWRRQNAGHLLFAATDRCIRDKLRIVQEGGFAAITAAQMSLFLNLDPDGTRLTTLAGRARLTKQSVIELVDRAEALGLVERRFDPNDGRAKTVVLTARGLDAREWLQHATIESERRVAQLIGPAFLDRAKDELWAYALVPVSSGERAQEAAALPPDLAGADRSVGRILSAAARRFARDALSVAHERGFRDVTEVLLALFRNLDMEGTRLTDLAVRARMTKQSMRELVDRAQALGFTDRRPDPDDRRAKTIMFTADGLRMLEGMRRGIGQAEARMARITGEEFLATLKARLATYTASMDGLAPARWPADTLPWRAEQAALA